ncbi:MAG: glycosyltransferase family 39 protein [Deltaproteobacteria bacterium]|nr:glycosyltransferase family 39 protein [Deltaproteobacteria bacterium]
MPTARDTSISPALRPPAGAPGVSISAALRPPAGAQDAWILLALGALLLVPGLGAYPLWDPGEGRNALASREMAEAGRWLVPLLYGEPYYDKPAALFGLLRAFRAALGESEFALRLPSALATLGTVLLLYRFACKRVGRVAAFLAGAIYLTAPEVVALGRYCNFDAALAFCTTWATVAWLAWLDERRGTPWSAWVAMGLGVLVKGPVALVLPLATAVLSAWRRGVVLEAARAARPLAGALLVAAVVLPWLAPAAIADPEYVYTFLMRHNVDRYLSSSFVHVRGPFYFIPTIAAGFFPWSLLLPAAVACVPWRGHAADAAIWAGAVIVFFSLGRAKLATYVLPAFPALSLWLAIALASAPRALAMREGRLVRGATILWFAVLALLPLGALVYTQVAWPELTPALLATVPLPLVAWLAWYRMRADRFALPTVCTLFATVNVVVLISFYLGAAPVVSRSASDALLAPAVRDSGLPLFAFRIQPASLAWYARVPVRRTRDEREIAAAARHGPVLVVTRARHARRLRDAGIVLEPRLDTRRHLLYATVPVP